MKHHRMGQVWAVIAITVASGLALSAGPVSAPLDAQSDRALAHLIDRITFGVRPGDVDTLKRIGVNGFVDQQLHPERIPDAAFESRLREFRTLNLSTRDIAEEYYLPALRARRERKRQQADQSGSAITGATARRDPAITKEREVLIELTEQKLLRAIYSERQLQEVLVDFWFNHFNIFAGKGPERIMLTAYERDAIRPNVLGKFRELLGATAHSPAMLFYLDNWMSVDPEAAARLNDLHPRSMGPRRLFGFQRPERRNTTVGGQQQSPNVSRRTGLNENYARELMELHTLGVDGGYTQQDVTEVARAFTGWTIENPTRRRGARAAPGMMGPQPAGYRFDAGMHDSRAKVVLGHRITAGGEEDGEQVLDILSRHPSTARFIATKLARRFIADDPPLSIVDRAAKRFQDTDGDLRDVVRTILTSPEFHAEAAYRAKVKNPFEFVVSAIRATTSDVMDARGLGRSLHQLGMPLYMSQPPTGYADRAEVWVNTGMLINRMNFAVALADNKIPGIRSDLTRLLDPDIHSAGAATRDGAVRTLVRDDVSSATRATLERAPDVSTLVALTIGSPEFQRR